MKKIICLSFILVASFSPVFLFADDNFKTRLTAIYDLYKTNPAESCRRLEEAVQSPEMSSLESKDTEAAYYFLANCNYQQKRLDQAVAYYTKTAELDPTNHTPLVDAGNVYFSQERYAEAEQKYKEALKRAPDPESKEKIRALIDRIPGKIQKEFTISTGVGYDSNVNSGPEDTAHLLYGFFNYTLAADEKAREDFYFENSATALFKKALDPKTWVMFSASVEDTAYESENDYNSTVFTLAPAYKKTFGSKSVTVSPLVNYQTLDNDSYQTTVGLNVTGAARVTKKVNVWPHVGGYHQNFYNEDARDAVGITIGNSMSYEFNPKTSWIGSLFYTYNDADENRYTYNSIFLGNNITHKLSEDLSATLGYSLQLLYYDDVDPAFGNSRKDDGHTGYLNFRYALKKFFKTRDPFLSLNLSYNKNNSNHSFQDRDRFLSVLKLTFSF